MLLYIAAFRTVFYMSKMSIGQNRLNTNDGKTKSERKSRTKFDPAEQRYKHVSCEKNRRSSIRCSYDKLVDLVFFFGLTDKERRSEWKIYVKSMYISRLFTTRVIITKGYLLT